MRPARKAHLRLGRRGEDAARRLLESKGCEILARNWRIRAGELDLVARDGGAILFVEVKTRRRIGRYRPLDNLGYRQKRRNFQAAKFYWKMIGSPKLLLRFDLIEVVMTRWRLLEIRHWRDYRPPFGSGSGGGCDDEV